MLLMRFIFFAGRHNIFAFSLIDDAVFRRYGAYADAFAA